MKHVYKSVAKGPLVLPKEGGGSVRLAPGQRITGPFYAKYVGHGLAPDVPPVPAKPDKKDLPSMPHMPPPPEPPKGREVARSKPAEEAPPVEEQPGEEPTAEENDTLPQSRADLEKLLKADLVALAAELALDEGGTKAELVERIAEELGL